MILNLKSKSFAEIVLGCYFLPPYFLIRCITSRLGLASKPQKEARVFEHFIIVGCSPDSSTSVEEKNRPPSILFQFPNKPLANKDVVGHFCFPSGIHASEVVQSPSMSSYNSIIYESLQKLEHSDASYVYMMSGDEEGLLYGICVTRTELLDVSSLSTLFLVWVCVRGREKLPC